MIIYPDINPNVFSLGFLTIKWYGICHLIAFVLSYWYIIKTKPSTYTKEDIENLLFYMALGVIFGGRIGYLLFYDITDIFSNPLNIFKIWLPGRSFHGGLLGVLIAVFYYAKKYNQNFFNITNLITPIVPIGIFLGRIGNFINGELWGRITTVPWGMVFPHVDDFARHPSQLYEALLEGIVLFFIIKFAKHKAAIFLIFYAIFRIFIENYREPDIEQEFFIANLTIGQILSMPMFLMGLILYFKEKYQLKHKLCNNI